jgi:hypothetical protein
MCCVVMHLKIDFVFSPSLTRLIITGLGLIDFDVSVL